MTSSISPTLTDFATSFEEGQPGTLPSPQGDGLSLSVGPGPTDAYCSRPGGGYTGLRALHYRATTGTARSRTIVDGLDLLVGPSTRFSYKVLPGHIDDDLGYPATYVALDLLFSDGRRLSDLQATDRYGVPVSAAAQGAGGTLYVRQWNHVECELGAVADGLTVVAVELGYDNPTREPGIDVEGWVDDLRIESAPRPHVGTDPVDAVDTRRGSHSSFPFSRGNTFPATAWPNGFNFLAPATRVRAVDWFYSWAMHNTPENRPALEGLVLSHQPSPWMGERNRLVLSPVLGGARPSTDPAERALTFDHDAETPRPYHYLVAFDAGLTAEMAPTEHGAVFRFAPPAAGRFQLVLGSMDDSCAVTVDAAAGTFTAWVDNGSVLSVGRSRMFVHGTVDAPIVDSVHLGGAGGETALVVDLPAGRPLTVRLATSFLSTVQAAHALALEIGDRSFDEVVTAARAAWSRRLAVLDLAGETEDQRITAYSCLYRLNLYPSAQFENVGTVDAPVYRYASPVLDHLGPHTDTETGAVVRDGKAYVNHGFWDTYRTAWPLYGLLYPQLAADLVDGFAEMYRTGGWIPRWSSPGYADLMTGTSSDVAFADLHLKGVALHDVQSVYLAGLRNATVLPPFTGVGRKDLRESAFVGFPSPDTHEPVSWAFEACINDHALAALARDLASAPDLEPCDRNGLLAEATYLLHRSTAYRNLFDESTGFFQSRWPDGTFRVPASEYDPEVWGGDYTETNAWNFAFPAPHDGNGLAHLYGGREALEAKLDAFMTTPEYGTKNGTYFAGMHEITEARDVRIGQFGVSNQPAHHIPFMYAFAGAPGKGSAVVRETLRRTFIGSTIGQGYPGDEDNGEMSAWYLFAASGFYPLQLGAGRYALCAPTLPSVTWHLPAGDLTVTTTGAPGGVYPRSVRVDGVERSASWIDHASLAGGATIEVELGDEPSAWGTGPEDLPPSLGLEVSPLRDVSGRGRLTATVAPPTGSTAGASVGTPDVAPLVDDRAATTVTLVPGTVLTWTDLGAQELVLYTVTSGERPAEAPQSWRLEGSTDGRTWTVLDERVDEYFTWSFQIRPFLVARGGGYDRIRLAWTDTQACSVAQVELLVR